MKEVLISVQPKWCAEMTMKGKIEKIVETLTNKKCENCRYNKGIVCESPKRKLCVSSIFPKGYEPKEKGGMQK